MHFGSEGVFAARPAGESKARRRRRGAASPRAPALGVRGGRSPRVPGRLTWPALDSLVSHPPFLRFASLIFTLDSVSERAGRTTQMSHSLSLEVMEMAEVAALLDRLAAGLAATPSISGVPSPSARSARPEPGASTCCCNLREGRMRVAGCSAAGRPPASRSRPGRSGLEARRFLTAVS